MNKPTETCRQCGRTFRIDQRDPADAPGLCVECREAVAGDDTVPSGRESSPMLPPKSAGSAKFLPRKKSESGSGSVDAEAEIDEAEIDQAQIDSVKSPSSGLLPRKRTQPDDQISIRARNTGPDGQWVLLPDGSGGFSRVPNNLVKLSENGEQIVLKSRSRRAALRYRIIVNVAAIVLGLAILFAVFWLAISGYI